MVVVKSLCFLLCLLAAARCGPFREIGRDQRAISSVCVEIKPSVHDKSQHSYFMCKARSPIRSVERAEEYDYPERHSLSLEHEPDSYFLGTNLVINLFNQSLKTIFQMTM